MLYIFKYLSARKISGYLIKLYKPTTKVHIELSCNGEKNGMNSWNVPQGHNLHEDLWHLKKKTDKAVA
jgi:hypothetical protein